MEKHCICTIFYMYTSILSLSSSSWSSSLFKIQQKLFSLGILQYFVPYSSSILPKEHLNFLRNCRWIHKLYFKTSITKAILFNHKRKIWNNKILHFKWCLFYSRNFAWTALINNYFTFKLIRLTIFHSKKKIPIPVFFNELLGILLLLVLIYCCICLRVCLFAFVIP